MKHSFFFVANCLRFYQSFIDFTHYTDSEYLPPFAFFQLQNMRYNVLFALSALMAGFGPIGFAQSCRKGSIMKMKYYLVLGVAFCQIAVTISLWYDYIYIHYVCRLLIGAVTSNHLFSYHFTVIQMLVIRTKKKFMKTRDKDFFEKFRLCLFTLTEFDIFSHNINVADEIVQTFDPTYTD